ncbi:endonuclease/exonuclease/phosphatase family protein [Microbacterium sp. CFBP9034]|uniref:endonuclease/exonuclease/phosphatase family protein n=1 Tax=Microbacterium sp. CFBP9034 TaxID=3096540 RepID=UPI002A6B5C64|nr:endonuclease/exonuclease/phosphatase family protein [Microbacterium sp. CFBP9034]MDY0910369.1 endonuclease/exonuclease/phosphatase family protein [Microbacterium sp. CFBP9034]
MKVISYNLRKHRAAVELAHLVETHSADVLCLQEADTSDIPETISGLRLADATQRNRLGLAVYYRENTYRALDIRALALKKSLHDRVLKPAEERLLGVRLHDIDEGRDLIVASFHAAPLTALNSLRRHQIRTALTELETLGEGVPALMVGDYNYPVFKEHLGQKVREQGYELNLSDSRTYTRYRFFRGHYDFATSVGFEIDRVRTLPQGLSDHLPILVTARLSPATSRSARASHAEAS